MKIATLIILSLLLLQSFAYAVINGQEVKGEDPISKAIAASTVFIKVEGYFESWQCTAVIIGPTTLLTANHCLANSLEDNGKKRFEPVPDDTLRVLFNGQTDRDWREVKAKAMQPGFTQLDAKANNATHSFDLGLIQLQQPIPTNLKPIEFLPSSIQLKANDQMIVAGFGKTETLTMGILPMLNPDFNAGEFSTPYNTRVRIESGDSGGPIMVVRDGKVYLAGIVSRRGFSYLASVFSSVQKNLPFIQSAMKSLTSH